MQERADRTRACAFAMWYVTTWLRAGDLAGRILGGKPVTALAVLAALHAVVALRLGLSLSARTTPRARRARR